jgi:hypothetical protein
MISGCPQLLGPATSGWRNGTLAGRNAIFGLTRAPLALPTMHRLINVEGEIVTGILA